MKSRIKATSPMKIIGYMINQENLDILKKIALSFNAEINFINENSANETIGFLAGFRGFNKSHEKIDKAPEEQCLIFSGFDNKNIDKIIMKIKENNILIPLKCVVTRYNQSWKLHQLVNELKLEHEMIRKK